MEIISQMKIQDGVTFGWLKSKLLIMMNLKRLRDNHKSKAGKYIFIFDIPRGDLDLEASN